jgi:hypothetical protein
MTKKKSVEVLAPRSSRQDLVEACRAVRRFQQDVLLKDLDMGGRVKVHSLELSRHLEHVLKAALATA